MKSEINPLVAVGVIIAVIVVVGGFVYFKGGRISRNDAKPPGMPADVAAEFQKRMGTATPTGSAGTPGAPTNRPMSGMMLPPMSPPRQ